MIAQPNFARNMQILALDWIQTLCRKNVIKAATYSIIPIPTELLNLVSVQESKHIHKIVFCKPLEHVAFTTVPTTARFI